MFLYWIIIKEWFKCCFIENHQSYYYILAPLTWTAFFYPYFATYYLLAYSSSLLTCSCWDLMVSRSRAMNKSTSSFHSQSALRVPLKIWTSLARNQKTVAIAVGTLLLHGITISTYSRGASVLQRAMVGILTYEASMTACLSFFGSATTKSLGSWNF